MKRKRIGRLVTYGLVFAGIALVVESPVLRTKAYYALFRIWYRDCPITALKPLPFHLRRAIRPVPVWRQVEPGVTMWLDPYDFVSLNILATGEWEPETWHALQPHIPAGGTFIDVGAHIGWYSLKAAKAVGPKGRVIAVEPNHETLLKLRDNIQASGAGAVVVVAPVACSDSETTLTFYAALRSNTGQSSLSLANASVQGRVAASYPVRARRLDDIVREAGVTRVDALKIDAEGAEFLVLKGAVETLGRYRPVVSVELIDAQLQSMGSSVRELMAFMQSHGYVAKQQFIDEANAEFEPVTAP